jgi:hypothetical protein
MSIQLRVESFRTSLAPKQGKLGKDASSLSRKAPSYLMFHFSSFPALETSKRLDLLVDFPIT